MRMFILGSYESLSLRDHFNDIFLTQKESDEGPETGSEDEGDSDEEEIDCEFLVSISPHKVVAFGPSVWAVLHLLLLKLEPVGPCVVSSVAKEQQLSNQQ